MKLLLEARALLETCTGVAGNSLRPASRRTAAINQILLATLWILGMSVVPNTPLVAAPDTKAYFAEPGSGRRVSSYSIELPVNRSERRSFLVPQDCSAITGTMAEGMSSSRRVIDRRLWHKVSEDCWFHSFLHRHPAQEIADYVSDYDFMNARLSDLPIDQDCVVAPPEQIVHGCHRTIADEHGMLKSFPLTDPHPDKDQKQDLSADSRGSECALRDGLFYGQLFVQQKSIQCTAGNGRPSLRLIAVDYADINGDRIMDAVLRFVPVGPGAARSPLILPVTRLGPEEVFSVPDFASGPPR